MKYKVMFVSGMTTVGVLATLEWAMAAHPAATWFALLVVWVLLMFAPMFVLITNADRQLAEYQQ